MIDFQPKTNGIYLYQLMETDYDKSGLLKINKKPILSEFSFGLSGTRSTMRGMYFIKFGYYEHREGQSKLYAYFAFSWIDPFDLADSYMINSQFAHTGEFAREVLQGVNNELYFQLFGNENLELTCKIVNDKISEEGSDEHLLIASIKNKSKGVILNSIPFRFLKGITNHEKNRINYNSI